MTLQIMPLNQLHCLIITLISTYVNSYRIFFPVKEDTLLDMASYMTERVGLVHQMPYAWDRDGFGSRLEKVKHLIYYYCSNLTFAFSIQDCSLCAVELTFGFILLGAILGLYKKKSREYHLIQITGTVSCMGNCMDGGVEKRISYITMYISIN